jgi:hypothetical protein
MHVEPQSEHRWLQRLVGEWTFEGEATMAPDKPPEKFSGSESTRAIGGIWITSEGHHPAPPGEETPTTIMTLGYDPQVGKFVGTFIGSMMTYLWTYRGSLNPEGTTLTLDAEGPDPTGQGKIVKYQDMIEIRSDDHRVLRSRALGEDGSWNEFMRCDYRRKK